MKKTLICAAVGLFAFSAVAAEEKGAHVASVEAPSESSRVVMPATEPPKDGYVDEVLIAVRRPQDTPGSGINIGIGFPSVVAGLVVGAIDTVKDVKKNFTHASEKMGVLYVTDNTGVFKVCAAKWALVPTEQLQGISPGHYVRVNRDVKDGIAPVLMEGGVPVSYDDIDAHPCAKEIKKMQQKFAG